jgi:hypothetical protein
MKLIKVVESQAIGSDVESLLGKIVSYLEKGMGSLIRIPGVEHFRNSKDHGYGIRFVVNGGTRAIRFNWTSQGQVGKATAISSIDVFDGRQHDPDRRISLKNGESFLQFLPQLLHAVVPAKKITEAKKGEFTPETALKDFIFRLRKGKTFTRGDFAMLYHMENIDVFDTLVNKFANQVTITNKRVSAKRGTDWEKLRQDVLAASNDSLSIDDGGDNESYEDDVEDTGVKFVDSLKHLESLVKGITSGSFNALFVAGKGGTGKTQTVEKGLEAAGLHDGAGYFKNTGSATAAGIYSLLFKYKKNIILFDDSDGALADQDSRNLIKAATDTKKIRKLAWTKSGSISDSDGLIPSSFNFEGRIIFISNLPLDKLDPDKSIRTRAFVIVINPSNAEMVDYMSSILMDIKVEGNLSPKQRQQVLAVVREVGTTNDISLRTLVRALNLAASGAPNWAELVRLYA